MVKFVNVVICNRLDDSNRNVVFTYDSDNQDIAHYLPDIVQMH